MDRRGDLVFAPAAVDREPAVKDEMRYGANACGRGARRLLLDALALCRIPGDREGLDTIEAAGDGDIGEQLDIPDVHRTDEIRLRHRHGQLMLGAFLARSEHQRMSGLRRIGPELAGQIEIEPGELGLASGRAKAAFGSVTP